MEGSEVVFVFPISSLIKVRHWIRQEIRNTEFIESSLEFLEFLILSYLRMIFFSLDPVQSRSSKERFVFADSSSNVR